MESQFRNPFTLETPKRGNYDLPLQKAQETPLDRYIENTAVASLEEVTEKLVQVFEVTKSLNPAQNKSCAKIALLKHNLGLLPNSRPSELKDPSELISLLE